MPQKLTVLVYILSSLALHTQAYYYACNGMLPLTLWVHDRASSRKRAAWYGGPEVVFGGSGEVTRGTRYLFWLLLFSDKIVRFRMVLPVLDRRLCGPMLRHGALRARDWEKPRAALGPIVARHANEWLVDPHVQRYVSQESISTKP
jgi:hypothetical protein